MPKKRGGKPAKPAAKRLSAADKYKRELERQIERCNKLARYFYKAHGYDVPEGYRFDTAIHPQEQSMWNLASIAFEFIEGTDMEQIQAELEDEHGEESPEREED